MLLLQRALVSGRAVNSDRIDISLFIGLCPGLTDTFFDDGAIP